MTRYILAALMGVLATPALAEEHGSPAQAKAMLDNAVAHYKTVGREIALKDFNSKKAPFSERDLYVFCIGPDHKLVADGGFPQFVGQSADLAKDAKGKSIGQAGWDVAAKKGRGDLHYQWFNPVTQLIEPKISYFAKVGTDVCGVGAYDDAVIKH